MNLEIQDLIGTKSVKALLVNWVPYSIRVLLQVVVLIETARADIHTTAELPSGHTT